jgi:hypothetical protein
VNNVQQAQVDQGDVGRLVGGHPQGARAVGRDLDLVAVPSQPERKTSRRVVVVPDDENS